jgi:superoxide reductase
MAKLSELFQTGDWKSEKHSPVIEGPDSVKKGEFAKYTVSVGKEVAHPNKTEHHIRWIDVYFHPEGEKFPIHIGKAEFNAHGASAEGADTSSVYTFHGADMSFKTEKPGTLLASSYCNVHGLWESSKKISVS